MRPLPPPIVAAQYLRESRDRDRKQRIRDREARTILQRLFNEQARSRATDEQKTDCSRCGARLSTAEDHALHDCCGDIDEDGTC